MLGVAGGTATVVKILSKKSYVNPEQLREQQQQIQQLQSQVQQLQNERGFATQSLQRFDDSYERILNENKDLKEQVEIQKEAIKLLRDVVDRYEGRQGANK
jgi:peptidoglycan hydrolase CwlO-like protein